MMQPKHLGAAEAARIVKSGQLSSYTQVRHGKYANWLACLHNDHCIPNQYRNSTKIHIYLLIQVIKKIFQ